MFYCHGVSEAKCLQWPNCRLDILRVDLLRLAPTRQGGQTRGLKPGLRAIEAQKPNSHALSGTTTGKTSPVDGLSHCRSDCEHRRC